MLRKNLFLLEYMVKNRIEKDTERLETIRSIGKLMSETKLEIEEINEKNRFSLLKKLVSLKEKPLTRLEIELIEEILSINT